VGARHGHIPIPTMVGSAVVATGDLPGRLDSKPQANGGINSLARTTVGTELGVLPNLSSYYLQALA